MNLLNDETVWFFIYSRMQERNTEISAQVASSSKSTISTDNLSNMTGHLFREKNFLSHVLTFW